MRLREEGYSDFQSHVNSLSNETHESGDDTDGGEISNQQEHYAPEARGRPKQMKKL